MRNYPVRVLSGAGNVTTTGVAFFVGQAASASFTNTCATTGVAGVLKIQGSNESPVGDPKFYVPSSLSWNDITSATSTIAAGVGPAIVLQTMNFQYIRAVFTGSGTSAAIAVDMSAFGV